MILSLTHVKYNTVTNKKRKTSASWKHFNAFNNLFLFPTQLMDWVRISLTFSKPWIGPWGKNFSPIPSFPGCSLNAGTLNLFLLWNQFDRATGSVWWAWHNTLRHRAHATAAHCTVAVGIFKAPCALHCAIRIGVVVVFQVIPMANYKHKSFVYTLGSYEAPALTTWPTTAIQLG